MVFIAASFIGVRAQTRRSKPKPLATPIQTLTGAEIISQAGDLQPEPIATPQPSETPRRASTTSARINELNDRVKRLETSSSTDADAKHKRMLLNLDILNRA